MKRQPTSIVGVFALAAMVAVQSANAQVPTGPVTVTTDMGCTLTLNPPMDKFAASDLCEGCGAGPGSLIYGVGAFVQVDATAANVTANSCSNSVTAVTTDYTVEGTLRPPIIGFCLAPGCHLVIGAVTIDTSDGGKATASLTNNICVLGVPGGMQVIFAPGGPISDDGIGDNVNDATCADGPTTPQIINKFTAGQKIPHKVQINDCFGNNITASVAPLVRVFIEVEEWTYTTSYQTAAYYSDVPIFDGLPNDIGIEMALNGNHFHYNVDTTGYEQNTIAPGNARFFRSCIRVKDAMSGLVLSREDCILESR